MTRLSAAMAAALAMGVTASAAHGTTDAPRSGRGATSAEILAASAPEEWRALDPENLLVVELEGGRVVIALTPDLAPRAAAQLRTLARAGFYDGLSFYRVIDGFVAQGGDASGERARGTAERALPAEFDAPLGNRSVFLLPDADGYAPKVGYWNGAPVGVDLATDKIWGLHCAGAVALARDEAPDTANTEFYVTLQPQRYLDRNLTVVGRVVEGMALLQALPRVTPPAADGPGDALAPMGGVIRSVRVAADLPPEVQPRMEFLREDAPSFPAFAASRRNRPEPFFVHRPNHVDVCALNVPTRAIPSGSQ